MEDTATSTKQSASELQKILEPWRTQTCTCVHCGKVLKNFYAKNSHLSHCKLRILTRYLKVRSYIFILRWNPLKRRAMSLQQMITDYPKENDPEKLPQLILGACQYLHNEGSLKSYTITELNNISTEMNEYPDGWVSASIVKKMIKPEDFIDLEKTTAYEIERQKVNNQQSSTTDSNQKE